MKPPSQEGTQRSVPDKSALAEIWVNGHETWGFDAAPGVQNLVHRLCTTNARMVPLRERTVQKVTRRLIPKRSDVPGLRRLGVDNGWRPAQMFPDTTRGRGIGLAIGLMARPSSALYLTMCSSFTNMFDQARSMSSGDIW